MLKSVIIDDEFNSRESLKMLLESYCENVEVCALCQNVGEALKAIATHQPDLVFLDIQLQRETGFDLLAQIKDPTFDVIFTTAFSEYAIKAFRFSALDYLLKPIDPNELQQAVQKAHKKSPQKNLGQLHQMIQNLNTSQQNYKLALPTADGLIFIAVGDIAYCEADSNYTIIHLKDQKKYVVSRTLKEYEELLAEHNFFRIHHSYLVNLNVVKQYVRGEGGYVVINDNISLDVSKRKKDAFLERIGYKS